MPVPASAIAGTDNMAFTMKALWRLALWGSMAAAALAVAVLVGRSGTGLERAGIAAANWSGLPARQPQVAVPTDVQAQVQADAQAVAQAVNRSFDAEAEAKRAADAVRVLANDRDHLTTRVTALEQKIGDVTGSVTKQLEAARAAAASAAAASAAVVAPWPAPDMAPTPPAAIEATIVAVPPPTGLPILPAVATPAPAAPTPLVLTPAAATPIAPAEPAEAHNDFAIDIGTGPTMEALRVLWNVIHLAHAQLFEGLQPLVSISDTHKSSRVELRLIAGPLPNPEAAAQLCAALLASHIACQPTIYDGQRLALR